MKHVTQLVSFIALGMVSNAGANGLTSDEILDIETNLPNGYQINRQGEIIDSQNKAMIDIDRPVGGTSIRYYSSAAAAMNQVSTANYEYTSPGCRTGVSSGVSMDETVDLPLDSKIVSFTAYGTDNDNSASASAYLYSTAMGDGALSIVTSYSSGSTETPGDFSIGGYLDYDRLYNESFFVRLSSSSENIVLCGFRIGYVPPNVASDLIFVNNFYR